MLVCWARGEWERLQPSVPGVHVVMVLLAGMHMLKVVSTNEGELIGVSTGSALDQKKFDATAGGGDRRETET